MCVIIAKPAGVNVPSVDIIKAAMVANPDGFALAVAEDGKIKRFRTMDAEQMIKIYKAVASKNSPFVFHARIATAGSVSEKNCHGWHVNGALSDSAVFFHNGCLSIKAREDMTDSETFLRDIYEPAAAIGEEYGERAINAVIGTSKFAFLHASGRVRLYGHYIDVKGVKYSNLYFEARKSYKPERKYGWERYAYLF